MDHRTVTSFLCFSLYFGNILGKAVLGSSQHPSRAGDGFISHLAVRSKRNLTTMSRIDTSKNAAVVPHDYMLFLYRTLSDIQRRELNGSGYTRPANTVTSFMDKGEDQHPWESGQHYTFDLSSLSGMDELVKTELRILRKSPPDILSVLTSGGNLYHILLYTCSFDGNSGRRLLDSRTVDILDGGLPRWEAFDVWTNVKAHQRNAPLSCFYLLVISELTTEVTDPRALGLGRRALLPQERAFLVAFSHTRRKENLFREIKLRTKAFPLHLSSNSVVRPPRRRRRRRRTALSSRWLGGGGGIGGRKSGSGARRRTRCGRKPLHVNFKDLGWDDWIIAPLDYEAHHCEGVCDFPLRSHLEPTNHAIIQTLMNSMDPDSSPPSCCVPAKLSPISILYIDSGNNVVYKQYDDMVVESCGCK